MKLNSTLIFILLLIILPFKSRAWQGSSVPKLHVEGRYLKDVHGNIVNLHGVAMTPSPWFNGGAAGIWRWNNYDVTGCLNYNKSVMNRLTDTTSSVGWYLNYVRLHIDPYWTNNPGTTTTGENDISQFNFDRLKTTMTNVIIPLIKYAKTRGMYIILRPPGVCPEKIDTGDNYHKYLLKVWGYVSSLSDLKNADNVMFELANEPIQILGTDGTWGSNSQAHFDKLNLFFQPIFDTIRANGAQNIVWIPGTGYQSQYKGYAVNPIKGTNIGYAIHIYPGYWGGNTEYTTFKKNWNENIKPVADFAPIALTETDWGPEKYSVFGKGAVTGVAGGTGFGANLHRIVNESGNVSWNLLAPEDLIDNGEPLGGIAFGGDTTACAAPCYKWFKDYAKSNYPRPDYVYKSSSDLGTGYYTNPVIFGDFPDPDVIRVGDVYYMVTTTMHVFPGATILKSYDLVNWEYCANPLEKIENTPAYNLQGENRYGHGQWASALQYKNGTFYLLFNTLEDGAYLLTATDPAGTWTKKKLNTSYYDPGLLFDPSGKTYVVYGINTLHIAELDDNFNKIKDEPVYTYTVKEGLEGSHLYKIGDYYYIYSTYGGWPAYQTVMRSKSVFGPYEEKSSYFNSDNIHQGALIQTQTGEWWTMLFYDKGAFGRFPNLQPVNWIDSWPVIGSSGSGVTKYRKPNVGRTWPVTSLPTNDAFRYYQLGLQWGWNHNPDPSGWSLLERPGFLRLKNIRVTDSLQHAVNTLTQRILGYRNDATHSYGTVRLVVSNLQEGDVAGLAVYQDPYAYIGVRVLNGQKQLVQFNNNSTTEGPILTDSVVYLRAVANFNNGSGSTASFSYSTDNSTYTPLGTDLAMQYKLTVFTGNKFCLFSYPTLQTGGYADFDWFSTEKNYSESTFFDDSFKGYSEKSLTLDRIISDKTNLTVLTGSTTSLAIRAIYQDNRSEDITLGATYTVADPGIAQISNGQLIARKDGQTTLQVRYKGPLGGEKTTSLTVNCSTFPLVTGIFNPSIYATGSFNQATKTLITGQYGFGGWNYSAGVDLSGYKYLVAKLAAGSTTNGVSFRIFDENSYWSTPASLDFNSNRMVVANLQNLTKNGTKVNLTHIYMVGFWSYGGSPIVFDNVYLTNSDTYLPPTDVDVPETDDKPVDVFTITGIRLRKSVATKDATRGLPAGIYIVGRKKIMVTNH